MPQDKMIVRLSPLFGGSYTQVKMEGVFPTAVPERLLRRLSRGLAFWSGYPVACVLSVDSQATGWCGFWLEHLALIPAHHLELKCVRGKTGIGVGYAPR